MADQVYHATGQVIDSETSQGLPGLRIEAWDVDMTAKQPLAVNKTQEDGRFTLTLDFRKLGFKNIPDIIFKVFLNEQLLEGAESGVSWNANTEEDVTILIRTIPKSRLDAKDRITTRQFLKGFDFIQQSDFVGLFQCFTDKVGTRLSVVADGVANTFTNIDREPIRPMRNLEKELINNEVTTVKRRLESENIIVNDVLPYNPRFNKALLADITATPTCLTPGQRVNLYEKDGTVKFYTVLKERSVQDNPVSSAEENQPIEIKKLEEELKATKEDSIRKEEQIIKLQQELLSIRQDQLEMRKLFQSPDFELLLKTFGKTGNQEKPES